MRVGNERFSLPSEIVEAILQTPPVTPALGVPPALIGLFNFRGAIVPAITVPSVQVTTGRHAIVVRISAFGRLAVLCDWVEDLETGSDSPVDGEPDSQALEIDRLCEDIVQASTEIDGKVPQSRNPRIRVILKSRSNLTMT